jgi:hypothetical protein
MEDDFRCDGPQRANLDDFSCHKFLNKVGGGFSLEGK